MTSPTKLDGVIAIEPPIRTLEEALSEIHVLWVRDRRIGDLVAWWYHPNREALEEKRDALSGDGYAAEIVRFVREDSSELAAVREQCQLLIERWLPSERPIDPVDHAWKQAAQELIAVVGRKEAPKEPDLSDPDVGRAFNAIGSLELGLFFGRRARLAQLIVDEARKQAALHAPDES